MSDQTPRIPDLWWSPKDSTLWEKAAPGEYFCPDYYPARYDDEPPAYAEQLGPVEALRRELAAANAAKAEWHRAATAAVQGVPQWKRERDEARRERDALRADIRAVRDEWDNWESKSSTEALLRIFALLDREPGREESTPCGRADANCGLRGGSAHCAACRG